MKMLLFSGGRSSDEGGDDDHSEGVGNKGEGGDNLSSLH